MAFGDLELGSFLHISMTENPESGKIVHRVIEQEMKQAYVDYAMSVIVGRALPDARDGLKPVHRRILFAMKEAGLLHTKPFKKSAHIVGKVLAETHPHGDLSVYDAMVRMAQDFSLRYPLVDGQGNWGSVDGDNAAAYRYTEARLSELAEEMLTDIDKETVDFKPNFDGSMKEPEVLPSKIPQLFVNGSTGIAVGMTTNIPTHNLREVCDAVVMILDNPAVDTDSLLKTMPGPDFPTGAQIVGRQGIIEAYKTGRGKVTVKAVARIEDERIIVSEIPYMVNKAQMIQEMADLVRNKRIEGIRTIRDESNIEGIRVVIELKSGVDGGVVLNQLYTFSRLKTTFGIIFLALVNNEPQLLTLKSGLQCFIDHRKQVVRRRVQFELRQAEEKAHVLEGLLVALLNIDAIVAGIKASATVDDARSFLMSNYPLSEIQARAILDMKLQKLASLERQHIHDEHAALVREIAELKSILASEQRIIDIIKKETLDVREMHGDNRKTVILDGGNNEVIAEHLIEDKDMVVTISHSGYIKRVDLDTYKMQRRGGRGVVAAGAKDEDWMEDFFVASAHTSVLFFTNKGQVHWLKVYEIPEGGRQAKGKPIVNLLRLHEGECVSSFVPARSFDEGKFLFMATKRGVVKKTDVTAFSNPRQGGIRALTLDEGDELVGVEMTDGTKQIMLATQQGMAIRFSEQDVRGMGRSATGVWGITLDERDVVVALEVVDEGTTLLTVTSKGYGKRTAVVDYRLIARGGKGVINSALSDKIGHVVGVKAVTSDDELMLISRNGVAIRMAGKDISVIGRATQGVRLMKLDEGDELVSFERIANESEDSSEQK